MTGDIRQNGGRVFARRTSRPKRFTLPKYKVEKQPRTEVGRIVNFSPARRFGSVGWLSRIVA